MRRRASALVALVIAAATLGAACGVPEDGEPRAITGTIPFSLLAPTAESTSTTEPSGQVVSRVAIYLSDAEGQLVEARRRVTVPASVEKAIRALLGGPTEAEAARLNTAITADTTLRSVRGPENGLVTIDLSKELLDITGRQQILALAQVVYTATSLPAVDRVLFEFDGEPAEVPNGSGELTSSPVDEASYQTLRG